jgi:hypothetical protein
MPKRVKPLKYILVLFAVTVLLLCAAFWFYVSIPVARVELSKDTYCRMEFHQWQTGNCILSYYENGVRAGIVGIHSTLLDNPLAVFPGPDGMSAICISWTDTYYAMFTVDFTRADKNGFVVPKEFQDSWDEGLVDFSNFKVRACTWTEVDFVKNYIQTSNFNTLANSVRGGLAPPGRPYLLKLVEWSTVGNMKESGHPKIIPED